jgi:gliding motility-associated-like protein
MFRQFLFTCVIVFCLCISHNIALAQILKVSSQSGSISACAGDAAYTKNLASFRYEGELQSINMVFTPSANFQVSTDGINFSSTMSLPQGGSKITGLVYVRTTALPAMGNLTGSVKVQWGSLEATVAIKTIVYPLPVVNTVSNQTLDAGATTAAVNFSGSAKGYKWINNTPSIGLAGTGGGNVPSFVALHTGNTPVTATITVTPVNAGYIYVPNANSNNVSVINTDGYNVVATIPVGTNPVKTIVSADGNQVYVLNKGSNSLSVIDALTNLVTATITVGGQPDDMQVTKDGSMLYVSNYTSNTVSLVSLFSNNVFATIPVGVGPRTVYISPDGEYVYISNTLSNTISLIDTMNPVVEGTIPDMDNAYRFVTSPDGTRMYVADLSANTVTVINRGSHNWLATIPVGGAPTGLVISPDGSRVYVSGANSSTISVINTATNSVIATIPVGTTPLGLSISPDGTTLYATAQTAHNVSVVNTATNTVTATISVPGTLTYASLSPDGSFLYIADVSNKLINVISTATNTLVKQVTVGTFPSLSDESIGSGTGCSGSPITFTITVNPPPPPTLTISGTLSGVTTTYGAASVSRSINVSSSAGPFLVTPPPGFEVSADDVNYSSTVSIGSAAGFTGLPVYIRLTALSNAGAYTGDVVISNAQISTSALMPNSTVTPAPLTFTASDVSKRYGEVLTDYTGPGGFNITAGSLKNGNTISSATFVYGPAKGATFGVGNYSNSVTITGVTGANGFLPGNYALSYRSGSINVLPADLLITANNVSKVYGSVAPAEPGFTTTGLQNGETISAVSYIYTTGAPATANAGVYANSITATNATGGTFAAGNYNISYQAGTLTITPAVITVTADNATRNYGEANPVFTVTYTGFVNGDSEAQLSQLPVITSAAVNTARPGQYPITASGASALNYSFIYVDGVLSVNSTVVALAVPNTFTPNNDGINDTWSVPALAAYPNCTVDIFNRFGIKVYSSVGYGTPWDGTAKGSNAPAGVYYYIIDTKIAARIAGNLTVVR